MTCSSWFRDLVELLPAVVPLQRSLCQREAKNLKAVAGFSSFADIIREQDGWLEEAVAKLGTQKMCRTRRHTDAMTILLT